MKVRNLLVVLGDQLDENSAVFEGFDPERDRVWMAEVDAESTHVWTHQARIAVFLSAMRHFAGRLNEKGLKVDYRRLPEKPDGVTLGAVLADSLSRLKPARVICIEPGETRIRTELETACQTADVPFEVREDSSFFCSTSEFSEYIRDRKGLRMEFFYREMRRRHQVLMQGDKPVGGEWNFDKENREAFGKEGPESLPSLAIPPDELTRATLEEVSRRFAKHPGSLKNFDWAITRKDALKVMRKFIRGVLPEFGAHQDAMWTDEPYLYHSRLSVALNLKLISPREVVAAVEDAHRSGLCSISSAEGYIRQILGWREYVRGIYHAYMPEYLERNHLKAQQKLPALYWTGQTRMNCLKQAVGQTLDYGYAHHIQRLMVTGLFALLYGVHPKQVHEWYLAVYVDAVEWVELPNTLGMSQYGDGGVMASKPYIASGKYISRMSNYCGGCEFSPDVSAGPKACPFSSFYWEFIDRHEAMLRKNPRIGAQAGNWARMAAEKKESILATATNYRQQLEAGKL